MDISTSAADFKQLEKASPAPYNKARRCGAHSSFTGLEGICADEGHRFTPREALAMITYDLYEGISAAGVALVWNLKQETVDLIRVAHETALIELETGSVI